MRVNFNSVDDFILDLSREDRERVYQQAVRVQVSKNPIDGNKRDAVKFQVVFQASAVVATADGGEYIMEVGEDCGIDYRDASNELIGSERADDLRRMVSEFCDHHGLTLRPGMIEP